MRVLGNIPGNVPGTLGFSTMDSGLDTVNLASLKTLAFFRWLIVKHKKVSK